MRDESLTYRKVLRSLALVTTLTMVSPSVARAEDVSSPHKSLGVLTVEEEQTRDALREKLAKLVIPEPKNRTLVTGLNMAVPGTGTLYATGDVSKATATFASTVILSGLLTGATWYYLKDDSRFKQYDMKVALPVIFLGGNFLFAFSSKPDEDMRQAAFKEQERLRTNLSALNNKEEIVFDQQIGKLITEANASIEEGKLKEALSVLTSLQEPELSDTRIQASIDHIKVRLETNETAYKALFPEVERLTKGRSYIKALEAVEAAPKDSRYEDELVLLKSQLSEKAEQQEEQLRQAERKRKAQENEAQAKREEAAEKKEQEKQQAKFNEIYRQFYAYLKAGNINSANKTLARLEKDTYSTRYELSKQDAIDLVAGNTEKNEPLYLRCVVVQVISGGFLARLVDTDDNIIVRCSKRLNAVDGNLITFGAIPAGTVSYRSVLGATRTVRRVDLKTTFAVE